MTAIMRAFTQLSYSSRKEVVDQPLNQVMEVSHFSILALPSKLSLTLIQSASLEQDLQAFSLNLVFNMGSMLSRLFCIPLVAKGSRERGAALERSLTITFLQKLN